MRTRRSNTKRLRSSRRHRAALTLLALTRGDPSGHRPRGRVQSVASGAPRRSVHPRRRPRPLQAGRRASFGLDCPARGRDAPRPRASSFPARISRAAARSSRHASECPDAPIAADAPGTIASMERCRRRSWQAGEASADRDPADLQGDPAQGRLPPIPARRNSWARSRGRLFGAPAQPVMLLWSPEFSPSSRRRSTCRSTRVPAPRDGRI